MNLIYGSTAIKFWFSDFNREPKDLDIISDNPLSKSTKTIEYFRIEEFDYLKYANIHFKYVEPNYLYTIKLSHISWNINWDKHMKDVIFLKSKWCKIDKYFYDILIKKWSEIHWEKKVKMNWENDYFFKNNISRKYNHDWLHEQFAFYDRPLNEKIRKDLSSPLCDYELWNKLTHTDKIKCALEELYVLTVERYIFIDNPIPIKYAKVKMLKQMIISTTTGWFNLFLKENFDELLNINPIHIINKINEYG